MRQRSSSGARHALFVCQDEPMAETFLADRSDGVLTVTLNRPDRLNATNGVARDEMSAFWREVATDPSVRCIVVTGAGRAFCAGADAEDMSTGVRPRGDIGYIAAVDFCPGEYVSVPIIVAVNGLCVGAGLNFVADGDLVLASESAWFSDPHVSVGQVSAMEPLFLAPKVPYPVIAKLVLLGSSYRMTAAEALDAGLVHEVLAPDALLPRAHELAGVIARQSPTALRQSLAILRRYARSLVADQLDDGWRIAYDHFWHPDGTEGPLAFMEKREPVWADPT
jgi:enoyl-CoA hydratase/carnithine racemase